MFEYMETKFSSERLFITELSLCTAEQVLPGIISELDTNKQNNHVQERPDQF